MTQRGKFAPEEEREGTDLIRRMEEMVEELRGITDEIGPVLEELRNKLK